MKPNTWRALALALVLAGCASGAAGEGAQRPARADRNLISAEEIQEATRFNTAYDLVQSLRPAWLRSRSAGTVNTPNAGAVTVYIDGTRMGGPESLRQIPRAGVVSLQYLDASDATTRFGTGNSGGAILVVTRSSR